VSPYINVHEKSHNLMGKSLVLLYVVILFHKVMHTGSRALATYFPRATLSKQSKFSDLNDCVQKTNSRYITHFTMHKE